MMLAGSTNLTETRKTKIPLEKEECKSKEREGKGSDVLQ
jgi:hypothetical protein